MRNTVLLALPKRTARPACLAYISTSQIRPSRPYVRVALINMSRKIVKPIVLKNIYKLGFATPGNFLPFLTTTKNFAAAKNWPNKIFNGFLRNNPPLIREVKVYNRIYALQSLRDTFYSLTQAGIDALELKSKQIDPKSISKIDHESGLNDILLGFIYGFPGYEVEIDRVKKLGDYKPDAIVKLIGEEKQYTFIIEFERSRCWEAIRKEKLYPLKDFKPERYDLPNYTKILIVYAWERFNVFKRPIEWTPSIVELQKKHFRRFKHYTDKLTKIFLFASFHDFTRLNESVWQTIDGSPRKLIQ